MKVIYSVKISCNLKHSFGYKISRTCLKHVSSLVYYMRIHSLLKVGIIQYLEGRIFGLFDSISMYCNSCVDL